MINLDHPSFDELPFWHDLLKNEPNISLFVVGNKSDLEQDRQVSYEEGLKFSQEIKAKFFETSAKTGKDLYDLFSEAGKSLAKLVPVHDFATESSVIDLRVFDRKNQSCNCSC
ncbi:Ras-related protein Rab-6A [Thelohanellus kitauei]|uniref:Ras-related protein Rab-6A n=1 Tax=Thelohanellus kitauei TaxID=669202 RepID=A0A0C2J9Q4_THEKT|nr:Ras-related protein Rab-6A [Thelohanellus kitauei]